MIDLSSEPSLGTLVLTKGGALKYTYVLPNGMSFPPDATGVLQIIDRSGTVVKAFGGAFGGTQGDDRTKIVWLVNPGMVSDIPAGHNFEVFVTVDGIVYKVRYGRVVRKEAASILAAGGGIAQQLVYEDDMQRNVPGPRWMTIAGRMSMQEVEPFSITTGVTYPVQYVMATRNSNLDIWGTSFNLSTEAASMWYAPLLSDNIEIKVGLADNNNGEFTVVFGSNLTMTKFLGVRFKNSWHITDGGSTRYLIGVQAVFGSAWDAVSSVGMSSAFTMQSLGNIFRITYNGNTKQIVVYNASNSAILTVSTASTTAIVGSGYRYAGVISRGSTVYTGPRLYYWKLRDV